MPQWTGKLNTHYNAQLKDKINTTRTRMQDKAITNISDTKLKKEELAILNKRLKFITSPQEPYYDLYKTNI